MNPNETPYALEIEDLSVEFRTRDRTVYAVNGLDLKIRKGETLGLVGETGAGKTTTGLAILNLIQSPPGVVTHGSISVNGSCVLRIAEPETETPEEAPVPAENAGTVKLQKETPAEKEPEKPAKAMRRKDQKPQIAEVIAVGPGGTVDGKEVTMQVKVGDVILYNKYAGSDFKLDGKEVTILKQSDVLAVIVD